ncbi:MAG: CDP-alcohol phosphatidyltransferase family protein, partial [Methanoregula sp.]
MNITALRPRFIKYLEPVAGLFVRCHITPNQISVLALLAGITCAVLFVERQFLWGSLALFLSAVLDLVDGSVARMTDRHTRFGAVFDWIVDKYVDALVLLGIGLSGTAIISQYVTVPPITDFAIVVFAIIGSLMNTFIKPVVYAEIGYREKVEGKIDDPLEGVGFFGRPETFLVLILGGVTG